MPVAFEDGPAKSSPLRAQIAQRHDVFQGTIDLLPVVVHEADEVVNLVVGSVHGRFPDLAFLKLAVSVEAVDPAVFAIELLGLGSATGDAQSLAEGAAGDANARQLFFRGWMALKAGVQLSERGQFRHGEVPPAGQDAVPDRADVPVGQEKEVLSLSVHGEVLRVDLHFLEVEFHQEIGAAE